MFNGLTGYSTKPPAPIGLSVYPTTLRRRLLVSQVPRRNPSGPGGGSSAAVALKGPAPLFRRVPRETGRPPPLWRLRLTCETLCGNKKDGTLLRGCHQLVRCLCVIMMPVIVAILFKFRSFPILFEWIPIFHCLLC